MDQATGLQKAANIDTGLSSERVVSLPRPSLGKKLLGYIPKFAEELIATLFQVWKNRYRRS
jgi:hypothetical protein